MFIVRDQQVRALVRDALARWIAAHLRRFFPAECAALGETGLRERIREGISRAVSHGFESEVHISQYLDLMFAFGPDFDSDPALPWARALLAEENLTPDIRMHRLLEEGCRHREGA